MLSATVSVIVLGVLPFNVLLNFIIVLAGIIIIVRVIGGISPRISE